ncbi:hypothetical protein [Chryseobacterium indologenes]|uniref:Uncharacterized protein n=1 Tax=Chryseobacterium indologenes TaxID=253 RepID=A0A0N0ZWR9_CHRID|nr:hypothetical protein [Chryseobacterium indologenes]KPE51178.1 hypothetical protein AOB46_10955 [Chryseobacterium indologenes]
MKQKLLLLLLSFFTLGMHAQTEENMEGFSQKMAEPFMKLEREKIPHGILLDYAWGLTDIEQYNSEKIQEIDIHIYGSVYKELFFRSYSRKRTKKPPYHAGNGCQMGKLQERIQQ